MDAALLAARVVLAAVFAVAAVAKLLDRPATIRALDEFGVPRGSSALSLLLPLAELCVAGLLLVDSTATFAGAAASLLLALFTAGIVNALRRGLAPDCGCFGNLSTRPVSRWTLVRNGALLVIALFVALGAGDEHLPAGVSAGAALAALAAGLISARTGRGVRVGGVAAADPAAVRGLAIGERAPAFELPAVGGERQSLDSLREDAPVVVLFLDSGCGSCAELHPHLRRWQRALREELRIAVVMRGDPGAAAALAGTHGVENVLLDAGSEPLWTSFRLQSTPSAVVVGPDGRIASLPARGPLAIEELVRQTLRAEPWTQPILTV